MQLRAYGPSRSEVSLSSSSPERNTQASELHHILEPGMFLLRQPTEYSACGEHECLLILVNTWNQAVQEDHPVIPPRRISLRQHVHRQERQLAVPAVCTIHCAFAAFPMSENL